jgi:hypothetical protein
MRRFLFCGLILCWLTIWSIVTSGAGAALGEEVPSGQATRDASSIVKESDKSLKPQTEKTRYRMTLVAPDGSVEQVRTFITYYKREDGVERTLQKFLSPPVLAGTGLLLVDRGKPETDIWMYLPTTRRIRRIAGHDKSNRYMGTEFSFEDFEGYRISAYGFDLVGEKTDGQGRSCWVIEAVAATAAEKAATGYSKKRYWIERKTLYPVRVEYYARDGTLEKVLTAEDIHRVNLCWRPRRETIKNLRTGRSTKLVLESDKIDLPLEDRFVSKRFLRSD